MRIDWYTKGVLTVIAVLLGVIALRPYVSPDAVAHAQGSFAGVQYSQARRTDGFLRSQDWRNFGITTATARSDCNT